jgi:hypothetical protein
MAFTRKIEVKNPLSTMLKVFLSIFVLFNVSAGTVTFVTHGMNSNAKTWVRDMCMAIHRYQQNLGFESDATVESG